MNSFLAKIGWKRMQTRKIKIIVPFHSFPRRDRKFQKNGKKIQKIEKYHYSFISSQNMSEKTVKREKIKIITPFRYCPTRNRKLQNNSKQI